MKNYILRYILPLFAVVVSQQIQAQTDSAPIIPMYSTSTMAGSGSAIPLAAETGPFAYDENIISIDKAPAAAGPRRVGWDDDDPMDLVPIGTLPVLLMLLLCGGYVVVKKRKRVMSM